MTENEKKLLQAKHRLEEAQMRDRNKERKARTRRLIQEGAILEKALPHTTQMTLEQFGGIFVRGIQSNTMILCARATGALLFYPEGRTYSPPRRAVVLPAATVRSARADAASAEALWTMSHHGGAAVIVPRRRLIFCFISRTVVSFWKQLAVCQ